jgi:hypothetical protein
MCADDYRISYMRYAVAYADFYAELYMRSHMGDFYAGLSHIIVHGELETEVSKSH